MRRSYSFKLRISRTVGLAHAVASRARTRRIAAVCCSLLAQVVSCNVEGAANNFCRPAVRYLTTAERSTCKPGPQNNLLAVLRHLEPTCVAYVACLCCIDRVIALVVLVSKPVSSVESAAVATLRILQSNIALSQGGREHTPARAPDAIDASLHDLSQAQTWAPHKAVPCRDSCASPSRPATPSCSP